MKRKLVVILLSTAFSFTVQAASSHQYRNEGDSWRAEKIKTEDREQKENRFVCDGRQYCSQMNSREEAYFFIQNCPKTKMDGDHDGVPCERDSRFPPIRADRY
ncbi:excalibur calcium-binding domain-containing protein [Pectobacterium brasiliense]|uniref:excalibur calcium-binding domain-containing protein n=1 Tax=Pectobacterium brasiliense TaxID=180957 RepID=UPI001969752D|nr:excalibur calcium-binding domain-containing protein [Pectobacterium brasiliense]MBN3123052.1 excalibur calcium-binding domain-containing protein [Pectobacterium brasiliense]